MDEIYFIEIPIAPNDVYSFSESGFLEPEHGPMKIPAIKPQ